jgi:hypothetical protein
MAAAIKMAGIPIGMSFSRFPDTSSRSQQNSSANRCSFDAKVSISRPKIPRLRAVL